MVHEVKAVGEPATVIVSRNVSREPQTGQSFVE